MEKATINVKWHDGKSYPVECKLCEHPTKYGNGTCVTMSGYPIEWGRAFYDTRYISFKDFGGFVGFCETQLEAKGLEIIR